MLLFHKTGSSRTRSGLTCRAARVKYDPKHRLSVSICSLAFVIFLYSVLVSDVSVCGGQQTLFSFLHSLIYHESSVPISFLSLVPGSDIPHGVVVFVRLWVVSHFLFVPFSPGVLAPTSLTFLSLPLSD